MKIKFLKLILSFVSVLFLGFVFHSSNVVFVTSGEFNFNDDIFTEDFYAKNIANDGKPCLVFSYPDGSYKKVPFVGDYNPVLSNCRHELEELGKKISSRKSKSVQVIFSQNGTSSDLADQEIKKELQECEQDIPVIEGVLQGLIGIVEKEKVNDITENNNSLVDFLKQNGKVLFFDKVQEGDSVKEIRWGLQVNEPDKKDTRAIRLVENLINNTTKSDGSKSTEKSSKEFISYFAKQTVVGTN